MISRDDIDRVHTLMYQWTVVLNRFSKDGKGAMVEKITNLIRRETFVSLSTTLNSNVDPRIAAESQQVRKPSTPEIYVFGYYHWVALAA